MAGRDPQAVTGGFADFFRRATGHAPYRYQVELAESDRPPDAVAVPTGSGKTQAVIAAWLYQRARGSAPRRLVYALPMRTLVEQTAQVALRLRDRLGLTEAELAVHIVMGGVEPSDWRERPERAQLLVGTIDMLLSGALNRGYANSRFAWPVAFGLLNNDCRWVFDEVQLMGPARATSAQLDGLRRKLGTLLPCETVWMSATVDARSLETVDRPSLGRTLALPPEDRRGALAARLEAAKLLDRVDLSSAASSRAPRAIAEAVAERHLAGSRSIVVLNTVGKAQATARELERRLRDRQRPELVLLHSRFRPPDRRTWMERATAEIDPAGGGRIVVATQVIEAGVDISSRLLATETAPFSSIVQRLGRCNRAGELERAHVLWLDGGFVEPGVRGARAAAPYLPEDLNATRAALEKLLGGSLSPSAVAELSVRERSDEPAVLRRRDLVDLFDTSPDLSGLDVDVAPFIRSDDDRNVAVFFRAVAVGRRAPAIVPGRDQPAPRRDELVQVPLSQLSQRDAWLFDYVEELWRRTPRSAVAPGATVMLEAKEGGYSARMGWDPRERAAVEPDAPPAGSNPPEAVGADPGSVASEPQQLGDHLERARREAAALAEALALTETARTALVQAAALHDVGKAHPVFQETLVSAMDDVVDIDASALWAKSGRRGGRHRRRYFRHELASALVVAQQQATLDLAQPELVAYLVAAHHGKVRLSIRPAPGESPPDDAAPDTRFALGVVAGDRLPPVSTPLGTLPATTLELACMELGSERSWTRRAMALRDDASLAPFRLALLEALVRVADWRASA